MLDKDTAHLIGFEYVLTQIVPASPYGLAAKQKMHPFLPGAEDALNASFSRQAELLQARLVNAGALQELEHLLGQLPDWRKALARLQAGITLADVDLLGLKQLLYWHAKIKLCLQQLPSTNALPALMLDFSVLLKLLDPDQTGSPSFYLADSYSPCLANVRRQLRLLRQKMQSISLQLDKVLAEQIGRRQLPTGEFMVPKIDTALTERMNALPCLVVSRVTYTDIYYRRKPTKQEEISRAEFVKLQAVARLTEGGVRLKLTAEIDQYSSSIKALLAALGDFDLLLAKIRLAASWRCIPPQVLPAAATASIHFTEARHPQVAAEVQAQGSTFQPICWQLEAGATVLTGANMAGKTVALRLAALLAAMAQHAIMVPATSFSFTLFEHIRFMTPGYSAHISGLSRFGSEVRALCRVLPLIKRRALLLYDELASSTNPVEGAALAQAIVEYTVRQASINLFATHYGELTHLTGLAHWQVVGLSDVDQDQLAAMLASHSSNLLDLQKLMNYSLRPVPVGQTLPQEALGVARLLGLPAHLVDRAVGLIINPDPTQ